MKNEMNEKKKEKKKKKKKKSQKKQTKTISSINRVNSTGGMQPKPKPPGVARQSSERGEFRRTSLQSNGTNGTSPRNSQKSVTPPTAQEMLVSRASPDLGGSSSTKSRKNLLDTHSVEIIDTLIAELVKKKPPKGMVVSILQDVLGQMEGIGAMPEAKQATLLCEAAASGDAVALKGMLESGANATVGDYDRRTPLHLAAEEGHLECVKLLVTHKANVNAADRWGAQPLDGAKQNARTDVEQFLIQNKATPGRVTSTQNTSELVDCVRLCACAGKGDYNGLKHLLDSGVDPCLEDYDFRTALHLASEEGHNKCVLLLLEKGANIGATDRWGTTPLQGAVDHGQRETAELLRTKGATGGLSRTFSEKTIGKVQEQEANALCHAAQKGDITVVQKLLSKKVDPNLGDYDLRRPLHLASEEGHLDVVQLLVEKGANVNAKDRWGNTPLSGALHNTHNDIVSFLKDAGAEQDKNVERVVDLNKRATVFFESTLRLLNLPKERAVPVAGLMMRLKDEFGFNLNRHKVLMEEISQFIVPRSHESVKDCFGGDYKAVDEFIKSLDEADYPFKGIDKNGLIIIDDCVAAVLGKETPQNYSQTTILRAVLLDRLSVPSWSHFVRNVSTIFDDVLAGENSGQNAQYIPELRDADSSPFALAVCTSEGQECFFGNADDFFSVQSTGKTFAYSMALQQFGKDEVHKYVGQEPSGRAFNDFTLTRSGNPFNPVTNAGSIVTCSMVTPELESDLEKRLGTYKNFLSIMSGGEEIGDCMDVFRSEQECAFRNFALANFMKAEETFPPSVDTHEQIEGAVNFYLRVCSTRVSTSILSRIAGTYSNVGVCPFTGQRCLNETEVKQTLQILFSCGMYDYSGEWACTIGMPAKSGVSGNIFIVVPGVLGMCVWSPKLDVIGNSVRGIKLAKLFSEKFRYSLIETLMRHKDFTS
eukprot:TRINITY_DN1032_c1_g1_i1.p1 TRINITY_DN1032_c1_g1~~TRINITY_DN1032_c1_g1_i1.p1  ORF type:complete len:934 (+),score=201.10 TRINITY_DN1032_c1_g1_i1:536-3337(+)